MAKQERSVWLDGKVVEWGKATVPILTHSMQYGSGIFEGIRSYEVSGRAAVFRLGDHMKRFANSAKILGMELAFSEKELSDAVLLTVKKNHLTQSYIRPFAFYNDANIGLSTSGKKVSTCVYATYMGEYFSNKSTGIRCAVSSWRRINPSIMPTQAKASGNYVNSIISSIEARNHGADEAIILSGEGFVAEGSSENVFLVEDGMLVTPPKEADILLGITRDSVIKIARHVGIGVEERQVHREELYTAEEVFFVGTAAEVTPVISIDGKRVGNGRPGRLSSAVSDAYGKAVRGQLKGFESWITIV